MAPNGSKKRVFRGRGTVLARHNARDAAKREEAPPRRGGFGDPPAKAANGRGPGRPDDREAPMLIGVDPSKPARVAEAVEPTLNKVVLDEG